MCGTYEWRRNSFVVYISCCTGWANKWHPWCLSILFSQMRYISNVCLLIIHIRKMISKHKLTDRQTDGRTDRIPIANTRLSSTSGTAVASEQILEEFH